MQLECTPPPIWANASQFKVVTRLQREKSDLFKPISHLYNAEVFVLLICQWDLLSSMLGPLQKKVSAYSILEV